MTISNADKLWFRKYRVKLIFIATIPAFVVVGINSSIRRPELLSDARYLFALTFVALCWGLMVALLIAKNRMKLNSLDEKQDWLHDAVNWNVDQLHSDRIERLGRQRPTETLDGEKCVDAEQPPIRWPWGNHHTEYLGHLEAAARKWWILYDPSDATTAPTNDMVSDWLQSNRNLSRERAKAIASMLRPDGLATGPRK